MILRNQLHRWLIASTALVTALLLPYQAAQSQSITQFTTQQSLSPFTPKSMFNTQTLSNGETVVYQPSHPYYAQIIQGIEQVNAELRVSDPGLEAIHLTYYIYNGKKFSPMPDQILLASEYVKALSAILYYNPNSNHIIASTSLGDGVTLGAASDGQHAQTPPQTPPPSATKRLTYHEKGHVKWSRMTAEEKATWEIIWSASNKLNWARPTNTYIKADGTTGRYYEINAEEGFCEAYADNKLGGVTLDSAITTFLNNVQPV